MKFLIHYQNNRIEGCNSINDTHLHLVGNGNINYIVDVENESIITLIKGGENDGKVMAVKIPITKTAEEIQAKKAAEEKAKEEMRKSTEKAQEEIK